VLATLSSLPANKSAWQSVHRSFSKATEVTITRKYFNSPAGLCDDHLRAELVEFIPEIFGLQVAENVLQLLAIRAFLEQRIRHRRDALSARAAGVVRFRFVLRIDRLRNRRSTANDSGTAGFPFCNTYVFSHVIQCAY